MTDLGSDGLPGPNNPEASTTSIKIVLDNDVILKSVGYGLSIKFWPSLLEPNRVGVLGAARYVLRGLVARRDFARDRGDVNAELEAILSMAVELDPSSDEVALAAEIEFAATHKGVQVDGGESQLAAIVVLRAIPTMDTGDKRAIAGLEVVLDEVAALGPIAGVVRCLEQVVSAVLVDELSAEELRSAVCRESHCDKTLSICFGCHGPSVPELTAVRAGLESYIGWLRAAAPRVLAR